MSGIPTRLQRLGDPRPGELRSCHDEIADLKRQLAECFRLSGADPDGDEDWRLAPRAVEEVRRLRSDYDDALVEIGK